MILITNKEDISKLKSRDSIELECEYCGLHFNKKKSEYLAAIKGVSRNKLQYCSSACHNKSKITIIEVNCSNCQKSFFRQKKKLEKSKNHFCSQSCSATHRNTHKTKGTRVSKLEIWLQSKLKELYPNEEIIFNGKEAINSELDIYFPKLKLAFELNGIFHYEPIYGENKLSQTKNNDNRKFQACIENGISLCIIDTSKQKFFKEKSSLEFLNIIIGIINNH